MSLFDDYFTNDDKPFAENLNSALLLSNVFDLTVGVEYPTMCSSAYWGDEESVKKCSVSIVKIVDYDGVSYNSNAITGTGTVKLNFYPNFNAFGKITAIEWTNSAGITCDVYSEGGQLIQADIPNGTITTQSAGFSVLQNFELRFHLTDATLSKFKVTMANREDLRYGATVGITNVTGLENRLTSIESKNTEQDGVLSDYDTRMDNIEAKNTSQDTAINGKAPTDHSSTGTGYGKATTTRYGHVIVDSALDGSSTNPLQNNVVNNALNGKASSTHTHGNISNDGKIGSTSGKPLITTTGGVVTTGSFGTGSGTFCQGNDSRLSNARTPTSHIHGNISNDGKIGSTSGKPIITTTSGTLTTGTFGTSSGQFAEGNHTHQWVRVSHRTFADLYVNETLQLAQLVYNRGSYNILSGYNVIDIWGDSTYAPPAPLYVNFCLQDVMVYIQTDGKIYTEATSQQTITHFDFTVMWHYMD